MVSKKAQLVPRDLQSLSPEALSTIHGGNGWNAAAWLLVPATLGYPSLEDYTLRRKAEWKAWKAQHPLPDASKAPKASQ